MQNTAKVIAAADKTATIEVTRRAMCDGCEKNSCSRTCAAGVILGSGSKMTAKAENIAGARVGDTVEIETKTSTVLSYAALVFIMPIVLTFGAYFAVSSLFHNESAAYIAAGAAFVLSFAAVALFERRQRSKPPKIVIVSVVSRNDDNNMIG